jgi:hypothetical protein
MEETIGSCTCLKATSCCVTHVKEYDLLKKLVPDILQKKEGSPSSAADVEKGRQLIDETRVKEIETLSAQKVLNKEQNGALRVNIQIDRRYCRV